MVTLKATSGYVNREYVYKAGEIFEATDAMAAWLMADAPGVIVRVVDELPAENKMAESAPNKSGRPRRKG